MNTTRKRFPIAFCFQPDLGIRFLTQNIEPMPSVQLSEHFHRPEFAVTDQKNGCLGGNQLPDISQQSQRLEWTTVPTNIGHPGPGDRDRSLPIGQADHQQLVSKPNLGPIHDQMDLSQPMELGSQPFTSNRLIPLSNTDGRIIQQAAQPTNGTQQLGITWDLSRNPTQAYRATLVDPDDQPDHIADLGNSLSWT